MKQAAKTMYVIGKIINIIEIVCILICLVCAIVGIACSEQIFQKMTGQDLSRFQTAADVRSASIALLIVCCVGLLISIAILVLANVAQKQISSNKPSDAPHIIMIVIGVFGDIFYLLGGVFGLIAKNNDEQRKHVEGSNKAK